MVRKASATALPRPKLGVKSITDRPLDPGDQVSFSVSQECGSKGASTWVSWGAVITVRPDESADDVSQRLGDYVMDKLAEAVESVS